MTSSFRAIASADGERTIAAPIRTWRQFTAGGGPTPIYSDVIAKEAEQVAQRFCSNTLTDFDRKQNIFSFNQGSVEESVEKWLRGGQSDRFQQVWMRDRRDNPKREIGCAVADCRGNRVLICRPESADQRMPSGVSSFAGFVEPQAEIDERGCAVRPKFIEKTKAMYNSSLFRVLVAEAVNGWLDELESALVTAERIVPLEAKPAIRIQQIGAQRNLKVPEAFIAPLSATERKRFLDKALDTAYAMYFPNGPSGGNAALTPNETWLLVRKTLDSVPLITQRGLQLLDAQGVFVPSIFELSTE